MDNKARSKPMRNILNRLLSTGEFQIVIFGDKWPICDFLISFFSKGFPLQKQLIIRLVLKLLDAIHAHLQKTFVDNNHSEWVPDSLIEKVKERMVVDGVVCRNAEGKEVRYVTALSEEEKSVCGFDLLRVRGKSYVIDVNGWSFVKGNDEYYDNCARVNFKKFIFRICNPKKYKKFCSKGTKFDTRWRLKGFISVFRHAANEAYELKCEDLALLEQLKYILYKKSKLPGTKVQLKPSYNKKTGDLKKISINCKMFTHAGRHHSRDLGENLNKIIKLDDTNAAKEQMESVKTKLQDIFNPKQGFSCPSSFILPKNMEDPPVLVQDTIDLLCSLREVMNENFRTLDVDKLQSRWCCSENSEKLEIGLLNSKPLLLKILGHIQEVKSSPNPLCSSLFHKGIKDQYISEYSMRVSFSPGAHDSNLIDLQIDGKHSISVAPRKFITDHVSLDF
ncbi:hypothetical protein BCR36DRAFT_587838, partial [Piromyces finnis]